jgi:vacuolar protein sorting-associated protein 13A/C
LGKFSLSLHWLNLGNQPVQVLIEDLYILVVPRKEDDQDPNELERRIQEAKLERLHNAEIFQTQAAGVKGVNFCLHDFNELKGVQGTDNSAESQGFVSSLLGKLLNNIQVTIKNVHIRYEDNISVPGVCLRA